MAKKEGKIIKILKKVGAILTGDHFVYTSGRHGSVYINKDFLYLYPPEVAKVGRMFAEKFKDQNIEVVTAPAVGGTILASWTAFYLSKLTKKEVLAVYTEKDKGTTASAQESNQIFRRGYDQFVCGKRVLVLEDLTTTGGSVKKTVECVRRTGGKVIAVCVMVNRDPKNVTTQTVGAPFSALGIFEAVSYSAEFCPLCRKNIPINTTIGHGKQYDISKKIRKNC